MRATTIFLTLLSAAFCVMTASASAATVPFEESFSVDASNWKNTTSTNPTYVATGGSDGGGYIQTAFAFTSSPSTTPVLFRGQDEFNSSGNAFVGNWVADGITKLNIAVRHNAPEPLNYFARISSPGNFPGATAVAFTPVLPNVWTELNFDISPSSPQFVTFEGSNFNTVFSNVGHIQLGVSIPASLASDPTVYTYGLDKVVAVPEPASVLLLAAAALGLLPWCRTLCR